jgi:membrane-associated phospholipid phosphatase
MRFASDRSRIVLVVGGAAALLAGTAGRAFVLETAVALLPVNAVVEALKWSVNRTRPDGDTNRRNSSFPSSHAANACAIAAVLSRRWRQWAIPAWLAALFVAASRVYLDRHWLSDVVLALVLAAGGAWLAAWVMKRRQNTSTPATAA